MVFEADTQALVWLRALQRALEDIQKNMEFCVRGQVAGNLSQEDFDDFVGKINQFAKRVLASTEGG